ncbi:MAG: leucine-rich repeat domain-containing protein, partial [Tidjanibacter sp.]|nr:leucine-rich repeat domain-containing protein [Tidjanibacter sp.]
MSPLEVVAQSMREIHYTATEKVEPSAPNAFGANIVSNEWDSATGKGVITFDGAVTEIGDWGAFSGCTSLTSITIPDSVTSIGDSAFVNCWSLTSITIPDSVTEIGAYAFYGCPSLASITIPEGVTSIGELAFYICSSFESITIPNSVTSIGDNAFCDCTSLAEFEGKFASEDGRCLIVDGVLNSFAPYGLTEYTIPDSVTDIGDGVFCNCVSLTSFTI